MLFKRLSDISWSFRPGSTARGASRSAQEVAPATGDKQLETEPLRALTRAQIELGYELMLGRKPESSMAVVEKLGLGSVAELRREFMDSDEFHESVGAHMRGRDGAGKQQLSEKAAVLTQEHIELAYKFMLGRKPESSAVVERKLKLGSVTALRREIMASSEFRDVVSAYLRDRVQGGQKAVPGDLVAAPTLPFPVLPPLLLIFP